MPNLIDEFTRECLAIRVNRKLQSTDVIDVLADQFILPGVPSHIRSDNGPEFVATAVRTWIAAVGARTAFIEPGSPWENGCCESFNSKPRDELLNGEIFYSLAEAKVVVEGWQRHHNTKRPHSSLGSRPPAPEVVQGPASPPRAAPPATPAVAANRTTQWGQANWSQEAPLWASCDLGADRRERARQELRLCRERSATSQTMMPSRPRLTPGRAV